MDLIPERSLEGPGLSYLVDGGALVFLWGALAGRLLLDKYYYEPANRPRFFSDFEGGEARSSWEMPGWGVTAFGGVLAAGMLGSGDGSRYYHTKGLAESLATGVFVTGLIKATVGRHRPDHDPAIDDPSSRRSFPSGHATQAFAIATYAALYLRLHVFDSRRGSQTLPWWEAATYGGILVGASALAGERVLHNRHHLTDVAVGGLLGTASSALFFWYQERRFREGQGESSSLTVMPKLSAESATVQLGFTF
ncbi:MAG: phosphatase PAP2 family protein [Myxococcota bacterium]|nr:phosphatase PAP2 family protein [Myxococcota bacterium]